MAFKVDGNRQYSIHQSAAPQKASKAEGRIWKILEAIGLADVVQRLIGRSRPKPADLTGRVQPRAPRVAAVVDTLVFDPAAKEAKKANKERARELLGEIKEITKKGNPTIGELNSGFAKIKEIEALKIRNSGINIEAEREHQHLQMQYNFLIK